MTINLAEGPQEASGDNLGANAARAASEALIEAAEHVKSLIGTEGPVLLVGLMRRLTDAIVVAEQLGEQRVSATKIREANRRADYDAGWDACLLARRGLRAV